MTNFPGTSQLDLSQSQDYPSYNDIDSTNKHIIAISITSDTTTSNDDNERNMSCDEACPCSTTQSDHKSMSSVYSCVEGFSLSTKSTNTSTSSDTGQEEEQRISEPLPRQLNRVSWTKRPLEIFYTPMMNDEDKELCYYSSNDFRRFRLEYKMAKRNRRNIESNRNHTLSKTRSLPPLSPITGLINVVTSFMLKASNSSRETRDNDQSQTSQSSISVRSRSPSKGGIAETCALVDTLYIF